MKKIAFLVAVIGWNCMAFDYVLFEHNGTGFMLDVPKESSSTNWFWGNYIGVTFDKNVITNALLSIKGKREKLDFTLPNGKHCSIPRPAEGLYTGFHCSPYGLLYIDHDGNILSKEAVRERHFPRGEDDFTAISNKIFKLDAEMAKLSSENKPTNHLVRIILRLRKQMESTHEKANDDDKPIIKPGYSIPTPDDPNRVRIPNKKKRRSR